MIFHMFLWFLYSSFLSFSNVLSLTFPDFHSTLPVYHDVTDKEKENNTKSIFDWERLPMYKYVYICIDHKKTVRGVTFFLLWLGRHTTVVKTGRMRMKVNGSNHGMKGKPKTCGLTITTIRNNVHRFLSVVNTRTNQTRGRHSFFFFPSQSLPLSLSPVHPLSPTFLSLSLSPLSFPVSRCLFIAFSLAWKCLHWLIS